MKEKEKQSSRTAKADLYINDILNKIKQLDSSDGLFDAIGHRLYDKWTEEALGGDVLLGIVNEKVLAIYYLSIEPDTEEFARFAKFSTRVSAAIDLATPIQNNPNPEVVTKALEAIADMQAEGRVGLRKFIQDMREKYQLSSYTDYNGDKFFIPLLSIAPQSTCECNCGKDDKCNKESKENK